MCARARPAPGRGLDARSSSAIVHAEFMPALAITAATLDKFATEIRHLARTEVREVQEPFARGTEGLVRDAPQAEPHHLRAHLGAGPRDPRQPAGRPRERRAVARARHLALVGRARDPARLDDRRSHYMLAPDDRACSRGCVVHPERMRENLRRRRRARLLAERCCWRWSTRGCRATRPTRSSSAPRPTAWDEGAHFRERASRSNPGVASAGDRCSRRCSTRRSSCATSTSCSTGWRSCAVADEGSSRPRRDRTLHAQGKVRDIYDAGDDLLMVATDRISRVRRGAADPIPDKGRVLTGLSLFWFEQTTGLVANHLLTADRRRLPRAVPRRAAELAGPGDARPAGRGRCPSSAWPAATSRVGAGSSTGAERSRLRRPAAGGPGRVRRGSPSRSSRRPPRPPTGHDVPITFDETVDAGRRGLAERLQELTLALYERARRDRARARASSSPTPSSSSGSRAAS